MDISSAPSTEGLPPTHPVRPPRQQAARTAPAPQARSDMQPGPPELPPLAQHISHGMGHALPRNCKAADGGAPGGLGRWFQKLWGLWWGEGNSPSFPHLLGSGQKRPGDFKGGTFACLCLLPAISDTDKLLPAGYLTLHSVVSGMHPNWGLLLKQSAVTCAIVRVKGQHHLEALEQSPALRAIGPGCLQSTLWPA